MGWMGIELDIATASIGAIGLSFCIDDALHFAADYQRNRRAGLDADGSLQAAFDHTGKAIFFSSMVLFVGFACMLFSPLKTVFLFGMLSCWMIFWALFAQMLLFSRLVKWLDGERATTT
jgi:predicted RND superfamily exporter protein